MTVTDIRFIYILFPLILSGAMLLRGDIRRRFFVACGIVLYGCATIPGVIFCVLLCLFVWQMCRLMQHKMENGKQGAVYVYMIAVAGIVVFPVVWRLLSLDALYIGLPFFVISCVSVLSDVYRGRVRRLRLTDMALYCFYPPKLIFGPVIGWREFLNCYARRGGKHVHEWLEDAARMAVGIAKLLLLARGVGRIYVQLLHAPEKSVAGSWLTVLMFVLLLWIVISGMSDAAIGFSAMLGVRLPENIEREYRFRGVTGFVTAMTLSAERWMTEYIHEPLASFVHNKTGCAYGGAHGAGLFFGWFLCGLLLTDTTGWLVGVFLLACVAVADHFFGEGIRVFPGILRTIVFWILIGVCFAFPTGGSAGEGVSLLGGMFGVMTSGVINDFVLFVIADHWVILLASYLVVTGAGRRLFFTLFARIRNRRIAEATALVLCLLVFYVCMCALLGTEPMTYLYMKI